VLRVDARDSKTLTERGSATRVGNAAAILQKELDTLASPAAAAVPAQPTGRRGRR
jgi:hypothetical protein